MLSVVVMWVRALHCYSETTQHAEWDKADASPEGWGMCCCPAGLGVTPMWPEQTNASQLVWVVNMGVFPDRSVYFLNSFIFSVLYWMVSIAVSSSSLIFSYSISSQLFITSIVCFISDIKNFVCRSLIWVIFTSSISLSNFMNTWNTLIMSA